MNYGITMKYYLNPGSEINCEVYLEEGGLLDVVPLNPDYSYGFTYSEVDRDGNKTVHIWHSTNETNENLQPLPLDSAYEYSNRNYRPDSNHTSIF